MSSLPGPVVNALVYPLGGLPPDALLQVHRSAFGKDVAFRGDTVSTAAGDYATIEGAENLYAAIIRRCITRQGEYRLRPSYGIGVQDYVKRPMTQGTLQQLRQKIVENLLDEPRIQSITAVGLERTLFNSQPALKVTIVIVSIGREIKFPSFEVLGG